MHFANGTVAIDEVPEDQEGLWLEKGAEAASILTTTCAPKVKQHLTCYLSHEVYTKLQATFEKDTEHQKCTFMHELYASTWDRSKNVMENISYIQNLAHQLNAIDQPVNQTAVMTKIAQILPPAFLKCLGSSSDGRKDS